MKPTRPRRRLVPTVRKQIHRLRRPLLERRRARELAERRVALSVGPALVSLEMTARCNLVCVTCRRYHIHEEPSAVRGVLGAEGVANVVGASGYMEPDVFEKALDLVRDTNTVELAGYGEPMLNPHFHEYVHALKARGHHLNGITNGTLLTEKAIDSLIEERFDLLSISIDGLEAETLRIVRGVDAEQIFGNLERLHSMKQARGLGRDDAPRLSVSFVMARFNIREMPGLARRLAGIGVKNFYAQNLEAVASPDLLGPHVLYTDPIAREEALRHVAETRRICAEHGMVTDIRPLPHAGDGWEPPGVAIDEALDVFARDAAARIPPKRHYVSLQKVAEEREAALAAWRSANGKAAGAQPPASPEVANPVGLPPERARENGRCLDFFRYAFVAWNGKILSCCFERFGVGDLNVATARDVWNGETYRTLRRGFFEKGIRSACGNCSKILE